MLIYPKAPDPIEKSYAWKTKWQMSKASHNPSYRLNSRNDGWNAKELQKKSERKESKRERERETGLWSWTAGATLKFNNKLIQHKRNLGPKRKQKTLGESG